jgi:four helix bundle protein
MKYDRFEQVPVWQAAIELVRLAFLLTDDRAFAGQGDLANQLQRAALSISNNVAEGFERGSTNELIAFLYYARGSAGEVRSILCLTERLERFNHLKSQISDLKSNAESCSRQIRGWADHLQNTDIKGQRHLNDQTRAGYDQSRRADAFRDKLRSIANLKSQISDPKSEISDPKSQIPDPE